MLNIFKSKFNVKSFIFLTLIAAASQSAVARDSDYFYKKDARLGCGTITSVRSVNQAPLYDQQYEMSFGSGGSSASLVAQTTSPTALGIAVALAKTVVIDSAVEAKASTSSVVTPASGSWENVLAVQIQLDDGSVINVPLIGQPKLSFQQKYEVSKRVTIFLLRDRNSIQVSFLGLHPLPADEKRYAAWCARTVDANEALLVVKNNANLVDESKVPN